MSRVRIRIALIAIAGGLLLTTTPSIAVAGDKTPLSSLRTAPTPRDRTEPEKLGVPGLAVKETTGARPYLELTAAKAQGYCIVDREARSTLQASTLWASHEKADQLELWRLVEKDDAATATLERTRLMLVPSQHDAWALSKQSIELRPVGRSNGITVWGYRDPAGDAVLLARGVSSGRELVPESEQEARGFGFVSSDCAYGAVHLFAANAKSGSIVQARGSLPPIGEGKAKTIPQFIVNGSIVKLSRDPEPLLDVRIRMID